MDEPIFINDAKDLYEGIGFPQDLIQMFGEDDKEGSKEELFRAFVNTHFPHNNFLAYAQGKMTFVEFFKYGYDQLSDKYKKNPALYGYLLHLALDAKKFLEAFNGVASNIDKEVVN